MPAPVMEASDIIAAITAHVGDDKAKAKEFAKALRAGARDVAQSLINIGGSQKAGELGGKVQELEAKVRELTETIETREQELTDARAKVPDAAQLEDTYRKKYEPKLTKEKERADAAEARASSLVTQVALDKAIARLITPNEQGLRADREYAELIAAEKLRGQIVPKPDGTPGIKVLGEEGEYDGDTLDAKIDALVRDFRPTIPAAFMVSNADSGAGQRSVAGGTFGLKSQDQIVQEKRNSPAFSGL